MPQNDFNPSSYDSVLSKILEKLEAQDKRAEENFSKMFQKQDTTNGRVTKLEEWKASLKGKIAGISLAVSVAGTLIGWYLTK